MLIHQCWSFNVHSFQFSKLFQDKQKAYTNKKLSCRRSAIVAPCPQLSPIYSALSRSILCPFKGDSLSTCVMWMSSWKRQWVKFWVKQAGNRMIPRLSAVNEASDLCAFTGCKTSPLTVPPESQCPLEFRLPYKNTTQVLQRLLWFRSACKHLYGPSRGLFICACWFMFW